ncbi:MAG TPA: hypothetical protein VMD56_05755 [Steroidobacteraceae bacterium]|nr:hypothetical protein [Steroidobacteraceae bacterium]
MIFASVTHELGALDQRVWWLFRAASTLHFVGLSLLVGSLLVMDLRALGVIRHGGYPEVAGLARIAALGLLISAVSGVVMLSSKPEQYWEAWPFRYKMLVMLIALLNAAWFTLIGQRKLASLPATASAPLSVKVSAALSLVAWLIVIVLGRSIFEFASSG